MIYSCIANAAALSNSDIEIKFGSDLISDISLYAHGNNFCIVSDTNTEKYAPSNCDKMVLPCSIKATDNSAETIIEMVKKYDLIVALGSGTICDLCKYTSHITKKPCIVFPTAPSVNAYASPTASLTLKGKKQSVAVGSPIGIYCDLSILQDAPLRLICSGFGDFISAYTAQTDWMLSHIILQTDYNSQIFKIIEPVKQAILQSLNLLLNKQSNAIMYIMAGLIIQGLGMHVTKNSYSCSQAEHQIAHCIETYYGDNHLHGEMVACTGLTMSTIQNNILNQRKVSPQVIEFTKSDMTKFGVDEAIINVKKQNMNKMLSCNWEKVKKQIVATSPLELATLLKQMQLPMDARDLMIPQTNYEQMCHIATVFRDRFTFLDLAYEIKTT